MQDDKQDQRGVSKWALPVSVATHLVAVALLIFGLPQSLSGTQPEQVVSVALVPPEKAQPAPPLAQPPKPQPPKQVAAQPTPPSENAAKQAAPSAMQPAVRFGEKDAGPRKSLQGTSDETGAKAPTGQTQPAAVEPPAPKLAKTDKGQKRLTIVQDPVPTAPKRTDGKARAAKASPLAEAKTLFSRSVTDDPATQTAMGKLTRDVRGATLCGTELREQLVNASPPYFPDLLPSVRLTSGAVIDVKAAFHANGEWRTVSFRCEVDQNATQVVSFAFDIGALIPRSDWQRLGLLSQ